MTSAFTDLKYICNSLSNLIQILNLIATVNMPGQGIQKVTKLFSAPDQEIYLPSLMFLVCLSIFVLFDSCSLVQCKINTFYNVLVCYSVRYALMEKIFLDTEQCVFTNLFVFFIKDLAIIQQYLLSPFENSVGDGSVLISDCRLPTSQYIIPLNLFPKKLPKLPENGLLNIRPKVHSHD